MQDFDGHNILTSDTISEGKTIWKSPKITRIDIKRTMTGVGSLTDFQRSAAANTLPS